MTPRIAGGSFLQFLHHFWALRILTVITVFIDIVWDLVRTMPALSTNCKSGTGRVCVLTGARKGIGFGVLKQLLELDYTVVCGVRNMPSMQDNVKSLRASGLTSGHVILFDLELKSLRSVKEFAEQVLSDPQVTRIDMLINHAGIYQHDYELTEDKLEAHFQVNYLSHYLLTELLLARIKETAEKNKDSICHIINTSSCLNFNGNPEFDNLAQRKLYVPMHCYMDTKLYSILHAKTLQQKLESEGISNIQAYAVHPGAICGDVWEDGLPIVVQKILSATICHRTNDGGATVILHPVMDPVYRETCGGKYFETGRPVKPNPLADNVQLQWKLDTTSRALMDAFLKTPMHSFPSKQTIMMKRDETHA